MTRVLITGACGFLGSHLATRYLDTGHEVWGVDDFSTSSSTSPHATALMRRSKFTLINQDVCLLDRVASVKTTHFDIVLNFACPASPPRYMAMPLKTLLTCVNGTKNVLDIASRCNAVLLHASTSEVYGDPTISPQSETYKGNVNTWGPRAVYDEGKRCAETLCWEYRKRGNDIRTIRIFNTYGPHMDVADGRIVTNFIKQAISHEDVTVYGAGTQTRSLCYVSDLVDGITKLVELDKQSVPPVPMNLGSSQELTVNVIADKVIELTGSTSKIVHVDAWQDDPMQRRPDLCLARSTLGWSPKVSLDEGLSMTIEYVKSQAT